MLQRVKEYFDSLAISQSKLKAILKGPQVFKKVEKDELFYEEKESLIIGNAVDCIITNRNEKGEIDLEEFYQQYYISDIEKPSDAIMNIVQEVYSKSDSLILFEIQNDLLILGSCNEYKYQSKWKDETRIQKIKDEGCTYYNELVLSEGKQILDREQSLCIWRVVESLLTHPHTASYFEKSEDIEILWQQPIYFKYKDKECKALLDIIIINHKNKTIIPIDLKTFSDFTSNFIRSVKKFRYDIQAIFYELAIYYNYITETNKLWDYQVLQFIFIVESTLVQGCPLVFTLNRESILIALEGDYEKKIDGLRQAFDLLEWYENNHPEMIYNKEIVEGGGLIELDLWQ